MTVRTLQLAFAASVAAAAILPALAAPQSQTLQGSSVQLDNLMFADVTVNVVPGTQGYQFSLDGKPEAVARTHFRQDGNIAVVHMDDRPSGDWNSSEGYDITLVVTVAPGTPLALSGFGGKAMIGDLNAPLAVESSGSGEIDAGRVTAASIDASGSADVEIAAVDGALSFQTSGSGSLKAGAVGATSISVTGSGDVKLGSVNGGLAIDISGSSDIAIGTINSATAIETSGSGDVRIGGGRATSFDVSTSGSGDIRFAGTAVNPQISTSGSGDICIDTVEGTLESSGADITTGKGRCS